MKHPWKMKILVPKSWRVDGVKFSFSKLDGFLGEPAVNFQPNNYEQLDRVRLLQTLSPHIDTFIVSYLRFKYPKKIATSLHFDEVSNKTCVTLLFCTWLIVPRTLHLKKHHPDAALWAFGISGIYFRGKGFQ